MRKRNFGSLWRGNGDLADVNEQELAKDGAQEGTARQKNAERASRSASDTSGSASDKADAKLPIETESAGELAEITSAEKKSAGDDTVRVELNTDTDDKKQPIATARGQGGGLAVIFMAICLAAAVGVMLFVAYGMRTEGADALSDASLDTPEEDTDVSAMPQVMSARDIHSIAMRSAVTVTAVRDGDTVWGSGVCVFSEGYVATLFDMVEDADSVTVTLSGGASFPAQLIGGNTDTNIALLKTDAAGIAPPENVSDTELSVGERLYAVGALGTQGLDASLVSAHVAYGRRVLRIAGNDGRERHLSAIQLVPLGDDTLGGCPLFNEYGEAVGIIILTDSSADFALTFDDILPVLESIRDGEQPSKEALDGIVGVTARLGVACEDHEGDVVMGARILSFASSDVDAALKLKRGDVIVAVGDRVIACVDDLESVLKELRPDDCAEVFVYREGQFLSFFVDLY